MLPKTDSVCGQGISNLLKEAGPVFLYFFIKGGSVRGLPLVLPFQQALVGMEAIKAAPLLACLEASVSIQRSPATPESELPV
jgi:hypothetical protein